MAGQLVQYVVVRADLLKTLNWPVGSVIAQACHACCAVTYLFHNDPHTQEYLKDLDNMHKVVLEVSIIFSQNVVSFSFVTGIEGSC
jgi:peptidyl-tRNA hydrolase